jgi:hypothetical protein
MRVIPIVASVFWLGVACSSETDPLGQGTKEAPRTAETGEADEQRDREASAAIERALDLEAESPGEARSIYESVLREYPSAHCDQETLSFRCADEAERRLRILACLEKQSAPARVPDPARLAASILKLLSENDPAALEALARCDFVFGPCDSDTGTNDVPRFALSCLTQRAGGAGVALAANAEITEEWARYPLTSTPPLSLLLGWDDAVGGWVWTGVCFEADDPCPTR